MSSKALQKPSPYSNKLTPEQKQNLITDIALFSSYADIQSNYGISSNMVGYYLKENKDKIHAIRRNYVNKLQDVKYAHKRFRIEKLVHLLEVTESIIAKENDENIDPNAKGRNVTENTRISAIRQAAQLVNQIRVEMEGNQLTVTGTITHNHQDSDLIDKALNILSGRVNASYSVEED